MLQHVASWLQPRSCPHGSAEGPGDGAQSLISSCKPPVCLIHGPFGSGKSTLLVAIIMMVAELVRCLHFYALNPLPC